MENVGKVIEAISEEMALLRATGVTSDELAIAREQVKSSYVFGRENVNNRMFANGKNVLLYGKALDVDEVIAQLDGITEAQIHEAAMVVTDMSRYSSALICGKEYDLSKRMIEAAQ
jgi:predicted Zn-dependent peptidase